MALVPGSSRPHNETRAWRRVGGYTIPDPIGSDVEALSWSGDDVAEMSLVELRVERRRVERAWATEGRRLDRSDPRRSWLEERLRRVTAALTRSDETSSGLPEGSR
jgi:hypothetical protein